MPEAAARIRHLPHGAPTSALSPEPLDRPDHAPAAIAHLPRPLLGFVGTLGDRVDWPLLSRLAHAEPRGSIVLVGRLDGERPGAWKSDRDRCLALCERPPRPLASAGGDPGLQPRVRRLPDPLPRRPPVQPRLLPDEDHGLHGDRPPGRHDGAAGMPALSATSSTWPRRPASSSTPSAGSSPRAPTTAAQPFGTPGPRPTRAAASSSGSSTGCPESVVPRLGLPQGVADLVRQASHARTGVAGPEVIARVVDDAAGRAAVDRGDPVPVGATTSISTAAPPLLTQIQAIDDTTRFVTACVAFTSVIAARTRAVFGPGSLDDRL